MDVQHDEVDVTTSGLEKRRVVGVLVAMMIIVPMGLLMPMPIQGRTAASINNLFHCPLFFFVTSIVIWAWNQWSPLPQDLKPQNNVPQDETPKPQDSETSPPDGSGDNSKAWIRLGKKIQRNVIVIVGMAPICYLAEAIQELSNRTASWGDARSNLLGTIAAGIFATSISLFLSSRNFDRQRLKAVGTFGLLCTAFCFYLAWAPSFRTIADVQKAYAGLPQLSDFETATQTGRWYAVNCKTKVTRAPRLVKQGTTAMLVLIPPDVDGSVTLCEMPPDWTHANSFELELKPNRNCQVRIALIDSHDENGKPGIAERRFELPGDKWTRVVMAIDEIRQTNATSIDWSSIRYIDVDFDVVDYDLEVAFDDVERTES